MDRTPYGIIREIVQTETIALRHYLGQVVNNLDPDNKGKVQVYIPELGWMTQESAPWCPPRQSHKMDIPDIGEWVEIYFMAGDISRPVYLEMANEVAGQIVAAYSGTPTTKVLYQNTKDGNKIVYDEASQQMDVTFGTLNIGDGAAEAMTLGNKLNTWISNFVTSVFNVHTHTCAAPGSPSGVPNTLGTAPTDILSTVIKVK